MAVAPLIRKDRIFNGGFSSEGAYDSSKGYGRAKEDQSIIKGQLSKYGISGARVL